MPWRRQGFYYGWVLVLALSLTETTSWGILYYSFSVFLTPMQRDLGWSTAELTGAFSLALLCSGLAALPAGRWLDRRGPRLLMTAGSALAAVLVLAWAGVHSLLAFFLIWVGLGIAMAAVLYEPAFFVVANWFVRYRGRALTILTFLGGFASVIFIPLSNWLVDAYGWRGALTVLAAILAVLTIPAHALLLRRHPSDLGLQPDGDATPSREQQAQARSGVSLSGALHDQGFWWLTAAFVLTIFANTAITVHLIPYLLRQGYSAGFAAGVAGAVGLMALPGRLIFTPLGSYLPRRWVTAGIFATQSVALLVLLFVHHTAGVIAFVALFGAGFGAITPARAALVAENYGAANYGSINSVLAMFLTVARSVAPVSAGFLVGRLGGYDPILWLLIAISTAAVVAVLRAESTHRPAAELEGALP